MSRRTVYLSVFFTCHAALASAQTQAVSDFPQHDHAIVITLERDGGRALDEALRTRPPRASALAVLLRQRYLDESLAVLSRIVAADGPELLPALKAAAEASTWWEDQRRRDEIKTAFKRIVDAAMTAASRRPHDEGANIERQALWLQLDISPYSRDGWATALRAFIRKYDGTPAALLAEVELMNETLAIAAASRSDRAVCARA